MVLNYYQLNYFFCLVNHRIMINEFENEEPTFQQTDRKIWRSHLLKESTTQRPVSWLLSCQRINIRYWIGKYGSIYMDRSIYSSASTWEYPTQLGIPCSSIHSQSKSSSNQSYDRIQQRKLPEEYKSYKKSKNADESIVIDEHVQPRQQSTIDEWTLQHFIEWVLVFQLKTTTH